MDRFQEPDSQPETPEEREAGQFSWYQIRKAAEKLQEEEEKNDEDG